MSIYRRMPDGTIQRLSVDSEPGRRAGDVKPNDDRIYEADELEFMNAMQAWKQTHNNYWPKWSDCLDVLKSLGYRKDTMNPSEITRQDDPSKVATCPHCGSSIPRADLPVTIPDPDDDDESEDDTPDFDE